MKSLSFHFNLPDVMMPFIEGDVRVENELAHVSDLMDEEMIIN